MVLFFFIVYRFCADERQKPAALWATEKCEVPERPPQAQSRKASASAQVLL
jgi:hypothetical protein